MNHLIDKAREFVLTNPGADGIAKKVEYIQQTVWVRYSAIQEIEGWMNEILHHPRNGRMPNMLIIGKPNNGKSTLLRRFAQKNKADKDEDGLFRNAPVLSFLMPEAPTESLFVEALLGTVGIIPKRSDNYRDLIRQAYQVLKNVECKILLIDEIHHLAAGAAKQQERLMNLMKNISTHFALSFIVAGTDEAKNIFNSDDQWNSRFRQRVIPLWNDDDDLRSLLWAFEQLFPFEERSMLPEMSGFILGRTKRTIGDIYGLLSAAAIMSLKKNEKSISRKSIEKCDY